VHFSCPAAAAGGQQLLLCCWCCCCCCCWSAAGAAAAGGGGQLLLLLLLLLLLQVNCCSAPNLAAVTSIVVAVLVFISVKARCKVTLAPRSYNFLHIHHGQGALLAARPTVGGVRLQVRLQVRKATAAAAALQPIDVSIARQQLPLQAPICKATQPSDESLSQSTDHADSAINAHCIQPAKFATLVSVYAPQVGPDSL
jgi:hypothetical protein